MLKRLVSSGILLTAAMAMAQEDYGTWSFVKELTVNTTGAGTPITANVAKYPLLVRLGASEAAIFNQAGPNGTSLRFTKADGTTRLPHSVDHWDAANQSAAVWVLADTIYADNAKGADIRMYWGKIGATDSSNSNAVFDTTNGFVAVWHLDANGTSPRPNAVAGGNPAIPEGFATDYTPVQGVIGRADTLTGGNRDAGAWLNLGQGYGDWNGEMTMSMWVKREFSSGFRQFISLSNGTNQTAGRDNIWMGHGGCCDVTDRFTSEILNGTASGGWNFSKNTNDIVNGQWTHLSYTITDGNKVTLYVNGDTVRTRTSTQSLKDTVRAANHIGRAPYDDPTLTGSVDEVRLSRAARSIAWHKLDYATQAPNATALSLSVTDSLNPFVAISDLRYEAGNTDAIDTLKLTTHSTVNITPSYIGEVPDSFTITGTLPAGVTVNPTTGVLSGTFTSTFNEVRTITAHVGATTAAREVRILVTAGIANLRYLSANTASRDTLRMETGVAVNLVPTYLGGPADSIKVTGSNTSIPGGLSINKTTGAITGTPTAAFTGNRTITAYFGTLTTTRDVRFVVTLGPPSVTYHPKDTLSATVGASFTAAPIASGRPLTKWTAVTALPAGLRLDSLNGAISGVPTAAAAAANYTVRGTNATDTLNKVIRLTVAAAVAGGTYKDDWTGHRRIKLNTSSTGANVAGNVVNVPVLVRFDATQAAVFTSAGTNGANLRFTKTDGTTLLKHEVDHWDATAQKGAVWVLVDTVKGNLANQEIWMHFGNTTATSLSNAHGVFSEANGFVSVFHLGAGTSTSPRLNAVAGRNPAYPFNLPATHTSHTGLIGLADSLGGNGAGANAQHFSFGPFPEGSFPNQQGTLSLWLKPASPFNSFASHAISLGSGTPNNNFWIGRFNGETSASISGSSGDATSEGDRYVGPNDAIDGWEQGVWQLVHFSLNVPDVNVYKNGRFIGSAGNQKLPDGVRTSAYIGRALWSADALIAGIYDEVRVANVARSADWVKLEYENQKAAQTLVTIDTLTFPGTGLANALLSGPALSYRTLQDGVLFNIRTNTAAKARIEILDMRGRAIWTRSLQATAGVNEVMWTGTERKAGSGIYFVRMLLLDADNKPTHTLERKLPLAR